MSPQKALRRQLRRQLHDRFQRQLRAYGFSRSAAHGIAKGLVDRELSAARKGAA